MSTLTECRQQLSDMMNGIKLAFRNAVAALHNDSNDPHRYRPDLRKSGMPRKRGKGQY